MKRIVTRRSILRASAAALIVATAGTMLLSAANAGVATVIVYKDPSCGCCQAWAEHLRTAGFAISVVARKDMSNLKRSLQVPADLVSCHTATVGEYVIEGHVPAADIWRTLREQPEILGLTVPGMPVGSPGMEVPGQSNQPYNVVAFDARGRRSVFSSHGG